MPTTEKLRNKLMAKLTELFQLDQPDLDFGFYRIMQAKAQQVKSFIDKDLLQIIEDAFGQVDEGRKTELTAAYENVVREAREEYGAAEPEKTPKAIKAKAALDALRDGATAESDVYDHLYRFFERYYDEGDFISRRYYARENAGKAAPFAIPYNGEEVKLHWANADQYYIKTAEYFSNYSFDITQAAEIRKMSDGEKVLNGIPEKTLKVHFRIVDASEGEHGNVKAAEDKKRFFILHEENPVEFNETQELVINFEYKALPGGKNAVDADTEKALKEKFGKSLNKGDMPNLAIAEKVIKALGTTEHTENTEKKNKNSVSSVYSVVLNLPAPTDKISNRPLLAKYINQYTARNTCDYFIHKDLSGFLKRELDFYIKNEVMHLDDIENADAPAVENYLAKLKVIRKIATKLIDFLAQLEDFQKKLWLKKKFVTETNYCITLDRIFSMENGELTIDNEGKWLLEQIANNDAQIQEWIKLGFIEENEIEDLKKWMQGIIDNGKLIMDNGDTDLFGNPDPKLSTIHSQFSIHLVLDTAFFSSDFKAKLIASIEDFDEQCDGLLIHSENFQALNLLQERYREQVKCVYIDPPYNTGGDDFLYKDSYQHSSWLSLITDRLVFSEKLIQECGSIAVSIDLKEFDKTISLLDTVFSEESRKNLITVKRGSATGAKVINPGTINISEFVLSYSKNPKEWAPEKAYRQKAYDNRYGTIIINFEEPFANWEFESVLDAFSNYYELPKSQLKKHFGLEYEEKLQSFVVENAHRIIQFVSLDENSVSQDAVTLKKQSLKNRDKIFHLERDGKNDYYIRNGKAIIFYKDRLIQIGESLVPGEPVSDIWDDVLPNDLHNEGGVNLRKGKKPEKLIHRLIEMGSRENELVMDFFMGSGTTGAVSFKSKRKWLGIEYSDYFDVVTLKRLKLTLFGDKSGVSEMTMWKGGGCFKYLRLESYEDTLNNLEFDKIPARDKVMEQNDSLREDYMLHYMLDVETRGSQSLLNIDNFANPTAYTLKVKKSGSDEQDTQNIDLIETFNYLLGLRLENMDAPQTFTASFTRKPDPELPEDQHTKLVVDGKIRLVTTENTEYTEKENINKNNSVSSVCSVVKKSWWFRKVEGWVPADPMNPNNGQKERVLIVWRKLTGNLEEDNLMLDEWFEKYRISTRDFEYDTIYVNGSNNLPNLKKDDENWKVRLIEETFHKKMWSTEGV